MLRFRDLVGAPGKETVAGVEQAIARASSAATDADGRIAVMVKERRAALISDDDAQVAKLDERIRQATADRDKAIEAGLALVERLEETRRREHQARCDAIHAQGQEAHDAAVALLKRRYPKWAAEGVAIMRELAKAEEAILATNTKLAQEGDPRRLSDPDATARPQRSGGMPLLATAVHHGARIPDATDGTRFAWPAADVTTIGSQRPQLLPVAPQGEAA